MLMEVHISAVNQQNQPSEAWPSLSPLWWYTSRLVVQSLAAPVCKLLSNAFIILGMLASKAEEQSRQ